MAPPASSPTDRDLVVAAVLQRYLDDADTMPDARLLPEDGPVLVEREIGEGEHAITSASLPAGRRTFALASRAELHARAVRTDKVAFIFFMTVEVNGDHAEVSVGADLTFARPTAILCCCVATDTYVWRNGRWTFEARSGETCA
jgi:hypothetical protein